MVARVSVIAVATGERGRAPLQKMCIYIGRPQVAPTGFSNIVVQLVGVPERPPLRVFSKQRQTLNTFYFSPHSLQPLFIHLANSRLRQILFNHNLFWHSILNQTLFTYSPYPVLNPIITPPILNKQFNHLA